MTNVQSLHKRRVEKTGLGAIRNVPETVKIIMQLPLNTRLSNSLDYKILVISQKTHVVWNKTE